MSGANTAVSAAATASTIPMFAAEAVPSINPRDAVARMEIGLTFTNASRRRSRRSTPCSEVGERFTDAFERGDVDAIRAMLAEDATFAMPPYPSWYRGRDAVADSWLMPGEPPTGLRYLPTSANGQLALAAYSLEPRRQRFVPIALDVLTMGGTQIVEIIAFRSSELFAAFGLPPQLDGGPAS